MKSSHFQPAMFGFNAGLFLMNLLNAAATGSKVLIVCAVVNAVAAAICLNGMAQEMA